MQKQKQKQHQLKAKTQPGKRPEQNDFIQTKIDWDKKIASLVSIYKRILQSHRHGFRCHV